MRLLLCWLLANLTVLGFAPAADDRPTPAVLNEDIEVLHAERMSYPLLGRVHVAEGAVVVKVDLEKSGRVRSASAVSGPKALINDSVENAKKWLFSRVGNGTAYIVYLFQIKGLCELPCPSNFEFYPPNVAIINMGRPVVMPATSGAGRERRKAR